MGETTITVEAARILDVLAWLQGPGDFKILVDLCGLDWPQCAKRFDVVYHFLSLTRNLRIRVKAEVGDGEAIKSCVAIYPAAGWFERECFDMYGVPFEGNPDLRRILTDYGFSGYPLRKDFPLTGYVELRYDDQLKRVVYQPWQAGAGISTRFRFHEPLGRRAAYSAGRRKSRDGTQCHPSGDPGKKP